MTRSERRLLLDTAILGVLLTLILVALDYGGLLAAPEQFFYDLRARHCQYFTPPPTDNLVHLDIDDASLETMGRWPWPRDKMAEIIDELHIAGTKAMAMDIIYSEPELPGYVELDTSSASGAAAVTQPTTRPTAIPAIPSNTVTARKVDHDAIFATAIRNFRHAVVPVSLNLTVQQSTSPRYRAMVEELAKDIEQDDPQLAAAMAKRGFSGSEGARQAEELRRNARREAMYQRIESEAKAQNPSVADLRKRILPRTDPVITNSPLIRLLHSEYERYQNVRSLRRFARPIGPDLPPLVTTADEQSTLKIFADAAGSSGFVDYVPYGDGIVRTVPLWANHRGFAFPQMGLALACMMLDVKPADLKLEADRIVIPCPDGRRIEIPVRIVDTSRGRFGMVMNIPWFGRSGPGQWETIYDYPSYHAPRQHVPMRFVWEASEIRRRIADDNANVDDAIKFLLYQLDRKRLSEFLAQKLEADNPDSRKPYMDWVAEEIKRTGWDTLIDQPPKNEADKRFSDSYKTLLQCRAQLPDLKRDVAKRRDELRALFNGKAVLIGYIAVGAIADFVPTSLHPRCPGVVVHGIIFNSIMTGKFWHPASRGVTLLITLALGLIATAIVAMLSPWKALAASTTLALGYLVFNGIYLFDKHSLLVGVAGPLTAILAVWAGGTLARYILETSERARVTRRFRNYVDPELVDFVLESDNARLDGQEKELTVVFTDLAGFTTLSEQLREKTVPLLNEYMGAMVPIIRKHRGKRPGYLNKLLGDGIMYFYGAPRDNPDHAVHAVESVLEMQDALVDFNKSVVKRNLPPLSVRAGLSSGNMVVGDAGPADRSASDYTVLGDAVNLGARLESANKAFGSRIMVNSRVFELAGDRFLFRPIGKLQVKGKLEGVMTYEPLATVEKATDEQKRLAELTAEVVMPFMAGEFARCLHAIEELEKAAGTSRLTALYRELCERYLREPPAGAFDGQIVLTEK